MTDIIDPTHYIQRTEGLKTSFISFIPQQYIVNGEVKVTFEHEKSLLIATWEIDRANIQEARESIPQILNDMNTTNCSYSEKSFKCTGEGRAEAKFDVF